jgi:hypothetical protein
MKLLQHFLHFAPWMIPGTLVALLGWERVGLAVGLLGALIALFTMFFEVSWRRTWRLFVTLVIARNMPPLGDRLYAWVDEPIDPDNPIRPPDILAHWLRPEGTANGRTWLVMTGIIVGLGVGAMISAHDILHPEGAWILPLPRAKDSLVSQSVVLSIAILIWGGAAGGLLTSQVYRRVIGLGVSLAACGSLCLGIAASQFSDVPIGGIVTVFSTGAAAVCIIVGLILNDATFAGFADEPDDMPSDRNTGLTTEITEDTEKG